MKHNGNYSRRFFLLFTMTASHQRILDTLMKIHDKKYWCISDCEIRSRICTQVYIELKEIIHIDSIRIHFPEVFILPLLSDYYYMPDFMNMEVEIK